MFNIILRALALIFIGYLKLCLVLLLNKAAARQLSRGKPLSSTRLCIISFAAAKSAAKSEEIARNIDSIAKAHNLWEK